MILTISDVFDADDLQQFRELSAGLNWKDGASTAGRVAAQVKSNMQADLSGPQGQELQVQLEAAIHAHSVLVAAARPARFSRLMISRTEAGGGYGHHVDNAVMGHGNAHLRTDLSFTLFLSQPSEYEGGELEIESATGTQGFKPEAGDLVLYPSTTLHRVAPVTSGTRLVCVGWIQSMVRRADQREVLFDLENTRVELSASHDPQSPEMLTLSKTMSNLLRMWSDV